MILLSGAGPGTYGPFFLDAEHVQIVCAGTSSVGSSGVAVSMTCPDEFGNTLFNMTATWSGIGPFSGGSAGGIPAGSYTVVVSANMSNVNITIRNRAP